LKSKKAIIDGNKTLRYKMTLFLSYSTQDYHYKDEIKKEVQEHSGGAKKLP